MQEWFYRIKGVQEVRGSTWRDEREWTWSPILTGFIEAETKQEARKKIEEELCVDLPMRVKRDDIGKKYPFFITIYPSSPDNYYTERLKRKRKCKKCGVEFTLLDKTILYDYDYCGFPDCCSPECSESIKMEETIEMSLIDNRVNAPVIYKITNKINGKCYIGQTTQPITLRWWQHLHYNKTKKFGDAILESKISDWTFEVIEIVKKLDLLDERERHYIDLYDSIENGYNSL